MPRRKQGREKHANKWVRTSSEVDFEMPQKRRAGRYEAMEAERVLDQVPILLHPLPPSKFKKFMLRRKKRKLEKLLEKENVNEKKVDKLLHELMNRGGGAFQLPPRAEYRLDQAHKERPSLTVVPRHSDLRRGKWPPVATFRRKGRVVARLSEDGYYRLKSEVGQQMSRRSRSSRSMRYNAIEFHQESKKVGKPRKKRKLYVPR